MVRAQDLGFWVCCRASTCVLWMAGRVGLDVSLGEGTCHPQLPTL